MCQFQTKFDYFSAKNGFNLPKNQKFWVTDAVKWMELPKQNEVETFYSMAQKLFLRKYLRVQSHIQRFSNRILGEKLPFLFI